MHPILQYGVRLSGWSPGEHPGWRYPEVLLIARLEDPETVVFEDVCFREAYLEACRRRAGTILDVWRVQNREDIRGCPRRISRAEYAKSPEEDLGSREEYAQALKAGSINNPFANLQRLLDR